jgi:hypothetical protein
LVHTETGGEEDKQTHAFAPEDTVLDAELAQLETLIYGLEPATVAAITDMGLSRIWGSGCHCHF